MEQILERLFLRLRMMVGRGRVAYVDDSGPVQIMQVRASGLELADRRVRPQEFGLTSNPPFDSDAVLLSVAGDRSATRVTGVNHQGSRPRGLKPGETKLYSLDGKYIYLTAGDGLVVDAQGQDVVVNNARDVTWNLSGKLTIAAPGGIDLKAPEVRATGDMLDNYETNERTMKDMREIHNEHDHDVEGVQPGSATIRSKKPEQQQ